ncbi:ubiquitin fusion degradation 1 [Striga asiatica]|uniref:Ubiquitin fusion degradation 1 n=1 Tax=Striga asiatica TaxID=4170 RepID=A0A5A7QWN1_STRAF|nr:ubiquitin fusion degradation 1 [Striga asiatica]
MAQRVHTTLIDTRCAPIEPRRVPTSPSAPRRPARTHIGLRDPKPIFLSCLRHTRDNHQRTPDQDNFDIGYGGGSDGIHRADGGGGLTPTKLVVANAVFEIMNLTEKQLPYLLSYLFKNLEN